MYLAVNLKTKQVRSVLARCALPTACLLGITLTSCAPTVPTAIHALYAPEKKGEATIVTFVDYECPYCRRNDEALQPYLQTAGARAHVVLVHVPLHSHPHADGAARASICAEAQGQASAMHHTLMQAAPAEMDQAGLARIAERLRLDLAAFSACLSADGTNQRLKHDRQIFLDEGYDGVPITWVGSTMLDGVAPPDDLRSAFAHALR